MTDFELLERLRAAGVKLRLVGGEVKASAPRGALSPELVGELKARKEKIRELLSRPPSRPGGGEVPRPEPAPRDGPLPLSFAQERLWFLDRLNPGDASYNMPFALRLEGALDAGALARALDALFRRHEALRSTFGERDGRPVLRVHPEGFGPALRRADLASLAGAERERALRELADAESRAPFDLAEGPLARATLVALGAREHALLLVVHHALTDGWSKGVLARELAALYDAFARGESPRLPPLPLQYPDYAAWQRAWLQGPVLEGQLAYWRRELEGLPPLELPTDFPRPAAQSHRGATVAVRLPRALADRLLELARAEGATAFMLLLAAFQALLARHSGQADFAVGSPVAGRVREEFEPLVGLFVNTLVLRARVRPGLSFRAFLRQTRDAALGAQEHQHLPFERLVEALAPERTPSRPPLVQVLFALQNAPAAELRAPGLTFRPLEAETHTAKLDLALSLAETAGGFEGHLEYCSDLFEAATADRLARQFVALVGAAVASPDRPLSQLSPLDDGERRSVAAWSNGGALREPDAEPLLHRRFERQVELRPDAPALALGAASLTYRELDARAARLARLLRTRGAGPEARVGVCLERGFDPFIAFWAVLKAGAAYVPLEPALPPERLAWLADDAQLALVVTQGSLATKLRALTAPLLCLDASEVNEGPVDAPAPPARPDALAYVIYTSGSTGRPKGVMVSHRNAAGVASAQAERLGVSCADRVLQHASPAFDASVWDVLLAHLSGACLVPTPAEAVLPGPELVRHLRRERVTVATFVPSLLAALPEVASPSLRLLLSAGEPCPADLVARWAPGRALVNAYGPTEATICASLGRCAEAERRAPPIGRPLPGATVHVLDDALTPSPIGAPGELYIGGAGVARGYLGRPALTAERFVPDPFSSEPGARLYQTGDRARWLDDGRLEFLGRLDAQVKVRGFRVEPGEVEAALLALPAVGQAAVIAREDGARGKRLVAYVVPAPGEALDVGTLRPALQPVLPEYMVPAAFVALAALPLTPNGKLDRDALPAPDAGALASAPYRAPNTDAERRAVALFASLLGLERVGADDDFFALGGHSLLAVQLAARVRDAFGAELPLRALFEARTPAALAARVGAAPRSADEPPLRRRGPSPAPLSFAQERFWFLQRLEPESPAYNVPVALRLEGALDRDALEAALRALAERHEILRSAFAFEPGGPVQRADPSFALRPRFVDLGALEPAARAAAARALLEAEARRPFALEDGPPARALLAALGEREHLLVVTLHHALTDGWSSGVATRELALLYAGFARGEPARLPELPLQYADYAAWQRERLAGPRLRDELAHWARTLAGVPALELPFDRPHRPAGPRPAGSTPVALGPALLARLNAFARGAGATPFMVLATALKALFHRYSGQTDLALGTPVAGRTRPEFEPLVGCFINTLVLRSDLSGDPPFATALGRVRDTTLGALAHQEVPFEKVVDALDLPRALGRPPLVQAMLVLNRAPDAPLELPGLTLRPAEAAPKAAKLDLLLALHETPAGLEGAFEYDAELFDAETVARLGRHFVRLLEGALDAPERRLSELPLLDEVERRHILSTWNDTRVDFPRGACLHHLFEAQARRTPDAVALVDGPHALTYARLDARADGLARALRARGVGPGRRAGVCLERSADLVAALLAVLKAGGAYVPLDPDYPPERLAFMLRDAGAAVLLTRRSLLASLPAEGVDVVLLEPGGPALDDAPPEAPAAAPPETCDRPAPPPGADHAAYVIYTSGSTGRPKGAINDHRAVVNRVLWMQSAYPLAAGDRVLHKTPFSFDVSVWELFWPLAVGATMVVARPGGHRDPAYLERTIAEQGVRVAHFVPSMLRAFFDALGSRRLPAPLRHVVCSGEALPADLVARFFAAAGPGQALHNLYGPTEAAVDVAAWRCRPEDGAPGAPVPIGRPIANARLYVLDGHLRPAPVGAPGELCIGGTPVGRGYLGRPALTAERFVPDPFSSEPGARMYTTGDRARFLADGRLEFLGRLDRQLKVRGHRVEPAEIEAALREHPAVRACAVTAREAPGGAVDLVAYVAPDPGATSDDVLASVEAFARQRLPAFLAPAHFVRLDALPLTASGKLDVRALPAPAPRRRAERRAPRDARERALVHVWQEELGVSPLGLDDDFFEQGGHSLKALRALPRLEAALGRPVPLSLLFEHPTVAALLAALDASARGPAPCLLTLRAAGERAPLVLVHAVEGHAVAYRDLARALAPGRPVYAFRARGLEPGETPDGDVARMAERYLEELRRARPRGPYVLGGWSMGGAVAFEMARRLERDGDGDVPLALLDAFAPTGAAFGPDDELARLAGLGDELARRAGLPPGAVALEELRQIPESDRLAYLAARALGGRAAAAEFDPRALASLARVALANARALASYRPAPRPGPTLLLRATSRPDGGPHSPDHGWRPLASDLTIEDVAGDHYGIVRPPHVEGLAAALDRWLSRLEAPSRPRDEALNPPRPWRKGPRQPPRTSNARRRPRANGRGRALSGSASSGRYSRGATCEGGPSPMNIDENMVGAIVAGAMPFLVVLVIFGAPVLFAYLRWSFKLREKELDLQRELALRGIGGAHAGAVPDGVGAARVQGAAGAPALPADAEFDLVAPEVRADRLLSAPDAGERAAGERVKF